MARARTMTGCTFDGFGVLFVRQIQAGKGFGKPWKGPLLSANSPLTPQRVLDARKQRVGEHTDTHIHTPRAEFSDWTM